MLQPHLLFPVEAGERWRAEWLLRLPEQPAKTRRRRIAALKSNFCIPGREVIFFNIFIFSVLIVFFYTISRKIKPILRFTRSEKKRQ